MAWERKFITGRELAVEVKILGNFLDSSKKKFFFFLLLRSESGAHVWLMGWAGWCLPGPMRTYDAGWADTRAGQAARRPKKNWARMETKKKNRKWRCGVSIPVPLAC